MYTPNNVPTDPALVPEFLSRELLALANNDTQQRPQVFLQTLNVAPTKPRAGMIVKADGTNWNPKTGPGLYAYNSGAWVPISVAINALWYGADPTGVADSTTAIAAAISLAASGAGAVYLPAGTYKVSSALAVSQPMLIFGDGYGTNIRTSSATANVFTVTSSNAWIRGLRVTSSAVRTAGWYVDFNTGGARSRISDFWMDGHIGGIRCASAGSVTIERGTLLNHVAATGVPIRIDSGVDISINDVLIDSDSAAQAYAGILIIAAGDVSITDSQIIHGGAALYLNPAAGQEIDSVWVHDTFLDTSSIGFKGLAAGGAIKRCTFNQVWFGSSTQQGALLQTSGAGAVDGMYFDQCEFFINGADGLYVADTGCINVHVRGGSAAQNTNSGYHFAPNVVSFSVIGARSGAGDGLSANSAYGINVEGGTSNHFTLRDNDCRGNTSGAINDASSGTSKWIDNNDGYVTKNAGTGTIASGTTAVTITHGLAVTPAAKDIFITPTANTTNDPGNIWVDTITATQFNLNCRVNPGASGMPFSWTARSLS